MKKIMMVCESFGGGVFSYVAQLCNDMCNEFDVTLVYSIRPQTPKNYKDFLNYKVKLIEIPNFGSFKRFFKTRKMLKKIEKEINPDIIHFHSTKAGAIGRLTFKGKNNRLIYTPHGYSFILMGNGFKSKLYYLAEKILGKKNCTTLACCESEEEVAKKICKKTFFIETGVNLGDLSKSLDGIEPLKNNRFTVFTLGRACIQKQPQLFNEIAKLVPEARFLWIGNGELESLLTAPNIEVTGWKSRNEALAMAKGADIFILCSLGEAIAMSLIENMYIKKLCIVSNTIGNKSVIKNNINGFVCNNAEEYSNVIKNAMKNFPKSCVENAYNDVLSIYNTKEMKKKYISFYNNI